MTFLELNYLNSNFALSLFLSLYFEQTTFKLRLLTLKILLLNKTCRTNENLSKLWIGTWNIWQNVNIGSNSIPRIGQSFYYDQKKSYIFLIFPDVLTKAADTVYVIFSFGETQTVVYNDFSQSEGKNQIWWFKEKTKDPFLSSLCFFIFSQWIFCFVYIY